MFKPFQQIYSHQPLAVHADLCNTPSGIHELRNFVATHFQVIGASFQALQSDILSTRSMIQQQTTLLSSLESSIRSQEQTLRDLKDSRLLALEQLNQETRTHTSTIEKSLEQQAQLLSRIQDKVLGHEQDQQCPPAAFESSSAQPDDLPLSAPPRVEKDPCFSRKQDPDANTIMACSGWEAFGASVKTAKHCAPNFPNF